ncbi:MAG: hypothetical protein HFH79_09690 [Lachnospiraceae bacterium]|nr:hypothetical protein [Lachnospiraceae bacterium]
MKKKPHTAITRKTSFSNKENTDGINYFTYDRQGGIIEEKNAAESAASPTTAFLNKYKSLFVERK